MKQLIIILAILPLSGFSQNNWEKVDAAVFMEAIREYEQSIPLEESYSLETGYRIYKDLTDEEHIQSFNGKMICKEGKELNVYQMGHLMIQDTELNITIDTLNKQLIVQQPDHSFYYRKTVQDYTVFSEMAEVTYRKTIGGKTAYMLEFKKGYPYKAIEFSFTEKTLIWQVVIYSNQPYYNESDTDSGDQAKVVMNLNDFRKGKAVDFSGFITVKDCVQIKDNELIPVGQYKDFELIDLRN